MNLRKWLIAGHALIGVCFFVMKESKAETVANVVVPNHDEQLLQKALLEKPTSMSPDRYREYILEVGRLYGALPKSAILKYREQIDKKVAEADAKFKIDLDSLVHDAIYNPTEAKRTQRERDLRSYVNIDQATSDAFLSQIHNEYINLDKETQTIPVEYNLVNFNKLLRNWQMERRMLRNVAKIVLRNDTIINKEKLDQFATQVKQSLQNLSRKIMSLADKVLEFVNDGLTDIASGQISRTTVSDNIDKFKTAMDRLVPLLADYEPLMRNKRVFIRIANIPRDATVSGNPKYFGAGLINRLQAIRENIFRLIGGIGVPHTLMNSLNDATIHLFDQAALDRITNVDSAPTPDWYTNTAHKGLRQAESRKLTDTIVNFSNFLHNLNAIKNSNWPSGAAAKSRVGIAGDEAWDTMVANVQKLNKLIQK